MRWEIDELIAELKLDSDRRILFVEGISDLAVWRAIVPEVERADVVIYPIAVVSVVAEGGERGRLISLAKVLSELGYDDRVHFFADADFDRVLGRRNTENVTLTDGRDLESYLFLTTGFQELCVSELNPGEAAVTLLDVVRRTARPVAMMRLCSECHNFNFPFQAVLEENRLIRYLDRRMKSLDADRLLQAMVQRSGIGLSRLSECRDYYLNLSAKHDGLPDAEVIHGKDLVYLASWHMGWAGSASSVIVSLALKAIVPEARTFPNLAKVEAWVRRAA